MSRPLAELLRGAPGALLLLAAPLLLTACSRPHAWGDTNSLIVGSPSAIWDEVQEEFEEALEPRVFTVRAERIFNVTHASPEDPRWRRLREFRQVLLIGHDGDPWVATALERAASVPAERPVLVQAQNVWARGQLVTVFLVSEGEEAEGMRALLPQARELLLRQFHDWTRRRMFASGEDLVTRDTLATTAGFSLLVPQVYATGRTDDVLIFRNDHPDPSQLIRSVLVTWRPRGEVPASREGALGWREQVASAYYDPPPVTDAEQVESRAVEVGGGAGVELRGVWSSPPDAWPAGGPYITRMLECPEQDRVYLLDSWVYAPGRDKYEYLVQIETILDSFDCRHPAS